MSLAKRVAETRKEQDALLSKIERGNQNFDVSMNRINALIEQGNRKEADKIDGELRRDLKKLQRYREKARRYQGYRAPT